MKTVAVVTATTGRDSLQQTIESVRSQTVPCRHYIFVDGRDAVTSNIPIHVEENIEICVLPVKTGGKGMMNGGIMAASAYLVQEDMIAWLDDDNWYDPDHIEELVKAKGDKPYAHSLRKLLNPDGTFYDYDDFESLGQYSGFVDLNCYLMDRSVAVQVAPMWYNTTGELMIGDRYMYQCLSQNKIPFGESGKYTVNYRLNAKRDLRSWLFDGNIKSRAKYAGELPWRK
jgi:glycosyltransferase involved in cell wall biosynthesis